MKQNLKRVLLVLCMVTCLFSLSACSQAETEESNVDVNLAMALEQQSQLVFGQFAALPAEQIELAKAMAEQSEQDVLVGGYESWANVQNDLGAFVSVDGTETRISEDSYMVDVRATFEKRAMTFTVGWSEEGEAMMVSSISITPDYTLNEKMEKAAMNTLMVWEPYSWY
ncbi:MAG: hypothetical protein ACLTKI_07610 [Lachnospiraceae bacterium]